MLYLSHDRRGKYLPLAKSGPIFLRREDLSYERGPSTGQKSDTDFCGKIGIGMDRLWATPFCTLLHTSEALLMAYVRAGVQAFPPLLFA
jgi:hypothetical protein